MTMLPAENEPAKNSQNFAIFANLSGRGLAAAGPADDGHHPERIRGGVRLDVPERELPLTICKK